MIPTNGAIGASIGTIIAELVVFIVELYYSLRVRISIKNIFFTTVPFYIFGVFMLITINLVNSAFEYGPLITIFIDVFIGGLVYIVLGLLYYIFVLKKKFNKLKKSCEV